MLSVLTCINSQSTSFGSGAYSQNNFYSCQDKSFAVKSANFPLFQYDFILSNYVCGFSYNTKFFIDSSSNDTNAIPANFLLSFSYSFSKWCILCSNYSNFSSISNTFGC